jgi:tRNA(Ile)-lysidine synthase
MASSRTERTAPPALIARLASTLERLPRPRAFQVAYSGGLDSTVLLHAMAGLREGLGARLHAVHVDHGLSPAAAEWGEHCRAQCERLSIELAVLRVDARPVDGEGVEAAARRARYRALTGVVGPGDCLLTAHHQDDQAETLLLQLLRGGGPRGLAAMPLASRFSAGWHVRPLLDCARAELRRYALDSGLAWVEDASNADTGLRRNFVRHDVLPRLARHWPAAARTLARSAARCAEAAALLREVAEQDLSALAGPSPDELPVAGLLALSPVRRANLLRHWIERLGLPLPRSADLARIEREAMAARPDGTPSVAWPGAEVRRFRGVLHAMKPLPPLPSGRVIAWDLGRPARLPAGGVLEALPGEGAGLSRTRAFGRDATIRFRQGGERCRPAGRGHRHALKKLLQEAAVPPWLRDRIPLLYLDDELVAVPGVCVCEGYQAEEGEPALRLEWRRE